MIVKHIVVLFLFSIALQASDKSPFDYFVVDIWPEYDHPGIRVIYTGYIKKDYLPLYFEAFVPDEMNFALAMGQNDTSNNLQPIPVVERNNSKWVSTNLVRDRFQLEFYFNPFGSTELRESGITIQLNQPLDTYHINIQHPLAAEQFKLSEPNAETFRDEHGFDYFRIHSSSLPAGQRKMISFSYINPSGKLSAVLVQEMLGLITDASKQQANKVKKNITRYQLPTYQPLAVLAVLSVIIGFIFWKSNHKKHRTELSDEGKNFCPRCDTEVSQKDRFCSNCGKPLL